MAENEGKIEDWRQQLQEILRMDKEQGELVPKNQKKRLRKLAQEVGASTRSVGCDSYGKPFGYDASIAELIDNINLAIQTATSIKNSEYTRQSVYATRRSVYITIAAVAVSIAALAVSVYFSKKNVPVAQESNNITRGSLELQKHDLYLTHKPIVFVTIPPTRSDANSDPLKDTFFLTNTGKLPAKNVSVSIIIDKIVGGMIMIDNSQIIPILEQVTLYPDVNLAFWIPEAIRIGGDIPKAQITFIIKYEGQGIEGEMTEKMKFIYTKDIAKWLHVGPRYDIFSKERKKAQEQMRETKR